MRRDGRFLHYKAPAHRSIGNRANLTPRPRQYADCPIPTLSEHILSDIDETRLSQIEETIQQVIHNQRRRGTTLWDWRQEVPMAPVTEIPDVDYESPVFPRVFTPFGAWEESMQLLLEMEQDSEAGDPFIQQTIHEMHIESECTDDNQVTLSTQKTGPATTESNSKHER